MVVMVYSAWSELELERLQLATKLKEIRPEIPILICTGYSEWVTKVSQEAVGVDVCWAILQYR